MEGNAFSKKVICGDVGWLDKFSSNYKLINLPHRQSMMMIKKIINPWKLENCLVS